MTKVLDRLALSKSNASSVAQVLKQTSEVNVTVSPTGETEFRIGGLGGGYTQILLNGSPVPKRFSLDDLSPTLIERIEITRTPTSDRSGEAIAGTINIVMRLAGEPNSREASAKVSGDPHGSLSAEGTGQWSFKGPVWSANISAVASIEDARGSGSGAVVIKNADGTAIATGMSHQDMHVRKQTITLTPSTRMMGENGLRFAAQMLIRRVYTEEFTQNSSEGTLGDPYSFAQDRLWYHRGASQVRPEVSLTLPFANGAKMEAKQTLLLSSKRGWAAVLGEEPAGTEVLDRTATSRIEESGGTSDLKVRFPVGESTVTAGLSYASSSRKDSRVQRDIVAGGSPETTEQRFKASIAKQAAFVQREFEALGGSYYLGGRAETLELESSEPGSQLRRRFTVVSPAFQASWKLDAKTELRAGISRTYRAPKPEELTATRYSAANNSVAVPDFSGNPRLKPEMAWGINANIATGWQDGSTSLDLTYRKIDDPIVTVESFDGARWLLQSQNALRAEAWSTTSDTKIDLGLIDERLKGVNAKFGITWNHSKVFGVPAPHNRLQRQSPLSYTLGIDSGDAKFGDNYGANYHFQSVAKYRISDNIVQSSDGNRGLNIYWSKRLNASARLKLSAEGIGSRKDISRFVAESPAGTELRELAYPASPMLRVGVQSAF
ncbi:MAG: TonB-dependent receptor [Rubrivivax sp.]